MDFRLPSQIIASTLAIFVAGFFFSSSSLAADPFSAVTYQDLKPRLLLRAEGVPVSTVDRDPPYLNAKIDGYSAQLAYTDQLRTYPEKQLFRVLYVSRSDDFTYTGTDMSDTGFKLVRLTLQPVDANLRAAGNAFEVATKAQPGETVKEFLGNLSERTARLSSLAFNRARVRDVLLNALDVATPQGVIPGNSKSQVLKIEKTRISWTFTHSYKLLVQVTPCPESLRDNACKAVVESVSYLPDDRFGHWVHPSNVRAWKLWGMTIVY